MWVCGHVGLAQQDSFSVPHVAARARVTLHLANTSPLHLRNPFRGLDLEQNRFLDMIVWQLLTGIQSGLIIKIVLSLSSDN